MAAVFQFVASCPVFSCLCRGLWQLLILQIGLDRPTPELEGPGKMVDDVLTDPVIEVVVTIVERVRWHVVLLILMGL